MIAAPEVLLAPPPPEGSELARLARAMRRRTRDLGADIMAAPIVGAQQRRLGRAHVQLWHRPPLLQPISSATVLGAGVT